MEEIPDYDSYSESSQIKAREDFEILFSYLKTRYPSLHFPKVNPDMSLKHTHMIYNSIKEKIDKIEILKQIADLNKLGYRPSKNLSIEDEMQELIAERDALLAEKERINKEQIRQLYGTIFRLASEFVTKDFIWFSYEGSEGLENCSVCKIKLIKGDRCRISDCDHTAHAECIARYMDRVEKKCPICKAEIKDKIKLPS